ncbi:MAG: MFS transporter [Eubacteriales bacterium]
MEFKNKLEKNINKQYVFHFISNLNFTRGIWMLYLAYKGLSLFEIGLMETVFHISSFLMEIPTGAIADIFGRKVSRTLGRAAAIVGTLIMILGNSTLAFAVAFVFSALSYNLESGAGEALVYDSLKEIGREKDYIKVAGIGEFLFNIASVVSMVAAGYVAAFSYENVYKIVLAVGVISLAVSLGFTEPTIGRAEKKQSILKTFFSQIADSFRAVKSDKRVLGIILASEMFAALYTTEFFYVQNKLKMAGSTTFEIGLILAAGSIAAAVLATQTHKLESKVSIKGIMKIGAVLGIAGFWGMSVIGLEPYAFVVLSAVEGMIFVAVTDYVNKLIPSQQRATILSLKSMMFSVYMIVLFPIAGKLGDIYGLGTSFVVIGVIATLSLGTILYMAYRKQK